jgi:hypothetical protein
MPKRKRQKPTDAQESETGSGRAKTLGVILVAALVLIVVVASDLLGSSEPAEDEAPGLSELESPALPAGIGQTPYCGKLDCPDPGNCPGECGC